MRKEAGKNTKYSLSTETLNFLSYFFFAMLTEYSGKPPVPKANDFYQFYQFYQKGERGVLRKTIQTKKSTGPQKSAIIVLGEEGFSWPLNFLSLFFFKEN